MTFRAYLVAIATAIVVNYALGLVDQPAQGH